MNTVLGRLMFVVVLPLFVLIAGDLFQESQAGSVKSSCLDDAIAQLKIPPLQRFVLHLFVFRLSFDTDCTAAYAQVCEHSPKECKSFRMAETTANALCISSTLKWCRSNFFSLIIVCEGVQKIFYNK